MPEYTFDTVLWAICRVQAESEEAARAKMLDTLSCVDIKYDDGDVQLTEASIEDDGGASELIQVDGVDV